VADVAATVARLSDPTADRMPTAVIADHLVDGIDRTPTTSVADDATVAVCLSLWHGDGEGADGSDEDDKCSFHGGERDVRRL
jgi:hypothetical protein